MLATASRAGFVIVVGGLATVVGLGSGLMFTPPGRDLLARVLTDQSRRIIRGSIEVGGVSGNFRNSLTLDSLVVRDTNGVLLATLPRVAVRYSLGNLLAGRYVLSRLELDHPRIHLRKHREGRLNLEEVLGLGEGTGGGRPPLILLQDVRIIDGIVTVRTPWSPPGQLRSEAQRDSALRAQRTTPGRRIEDAGPDGLVQVRTVELAYGRFGDMRLSSPDRAPIAMRIDSLYFAMNDPLFTITDARGELSTANDTLRFDLAHAGMPGTSLVGEGMLTWPRDTLMFDFEFDAKRVALADLRFVSPEFPDLHGSGRITAYSVSGRETHYDIRDLELRDRETRVSGALVALAHKLRGLGFRELDLRFRDLDLDVVRAYLDTIPFEGRLSGSLRADGYFDAMRVIFDWTFADPRVPGSPPNRIAMQGDVSLGGEQGIVFHETRVTGADLDLATVRLAVPAVILEGRMQGEGALEGPWRDVEFRGRLEHRDGDRPRSMASGRFGFDTRGAITAFDADFAFAPLDLEGVRRAFPALAAQGRLWGPVTLTGRLDTLALHADLQGELGRVQAAGVVSATPPRWAADSLWLGFEELDLALARGLGPSTRLNGSAVLRGSLDSAAAPEGAVRLDLRSGSVRELSFDSLRAGLAVRDSVLQVDSATLRWPGGSAEATGTLGWAAGRTGTLAIDFRVPNLSGLDSLLASIAPVEADSGASRAPLSGSAEGRVTLTGSLDSLGGASAIRAGPLAWKHYRSPSAAATAEWSAGARSLDARLRLDSLIVGRMRFAELAVDLEGASEDLEFRVAGRGPMIRGLATGRLTRGEERVLGLSTAELDLGASRWRLTDRVRVRLGDSLQFESPLRLMTDQGGATLAAEGTLPYRAPGELDLRLVGLDLRDIYAALQRDTSDARGFVQADLRIAGTGADPTVRGTMAVTGPVFGDFRGPLARAALNYRNRRLDANLTLWRTGTPVMQVGAALPINLAWLGSPEERQVPGEIAIRAQADGMDLGALEAFTTNLRRVQGAMQVDVVVSGTWDEPRLGGTVLIREGYGTVPSLGVAYGPVDGDLTFRGDSVLVDTLRVGGETGALNVRGQVRLVRLTRPVLDLALNARAFKVMDVPGFLTLEIDGAVDLNGPVTQPVMTGSATARNSVLYFRDLITKNIVNLEDPLFADLVDREALERRGLGAQFQSRFLDSLRIVNFRFLAAERVWLRSNEANIQLEGSVTVNKERSNYRLDGTFNAQRGTYTLQLWPLPVTRTFEVERGVVRYLNTPDLDADLDIDARHIVRFGEAGAQDVAVLAHIEGNLLTPRLRLESSGIRPPLSQSDIVSLLLLGRAFNSQVVSSQQGQLYQAAVYGVASALTGAVERSLIQGGGVDLLEIRPGLTYSGIASGTSLTRLAAGWQLGNQWFVTLNAGFCPNFDQVDYRNFGAGIEYRISRSLVLSASAEPTQICLAASRSTALRYQLGTDLRWVREY